MTGSSRRLTAAELSEATGVPIKRIERWRAQGWIASAGQIPSRGRGALAHVYDPHAADVEREIARYRERGMKDDTPTKG
ncbi:hypothetical protein Back2_17750 [Nocardioides baekrokdamisoli]|uniref:HTH merR-type domain-containing protein n=1 Tax=Nocardioides baekrokdamisoli TaxID=1804624 RepID=A0A3G9J1R1_9ACTN|nr:hypothetical protein [Nocardioides baekrokdamisoli]BBH17488.1 hypothetical protein Back2_17750 [Nocardioides baekrokdamisoli]